MMMDVSFWSQLSKSYSLILAVMIFFQSLSYTVTEDVGSLNIAIMSDKPLLHNTSLRIYDVMDAANGMDTIINQSIRNKIDIY